MESRRAKAILGTVIVVLVFGFIMTISRGERSRELVLQIEPIDQSDEVTVYVDGAVEDPGLFALPRGARVSEALDLAGLLESADTSGLPLARVLQDEQSLTVPEQTASSPTASPEHSRTSQDNPSELINLNQATETELQELPGIGPAIAERVRAHRDLEGPFQSLDELSDVSGISDRMVDELRDHLTVDP